MARKKISVLLKKLRKDLELTQVKLAEKLHVSQVSIATWEGDIRIPSTRMLIRIVEFCKSHKIKISMDQFIR